MLVKKCLELLKVWRAQKVYEKKQEVAAWEVLMATPEGVVWQTSKDLHAQSASTVKELETAIREKTVRLYARMGDKKRWPGVTIAEYKVVKIVGDAWEWAKENAPVLLITTLDKKPFEALVKTGKVPEDIAWVGIDPRARISKELP